MLNPTFRSFPRSRNTAVAAACLAVLVTACGAAVETKSDMQFDALEGERGEFVSCAPRLDDRPIVEDVGHIGNDGLACYLTTEVNNKIDLGLFGTPANLTAARKLRDCLKVCLAATHLGPGGTPCYSDADAFDTGDRCIAALVSCEADTCGGPKVTIRRTRTFPRPVTAGH